MVKHLLVIVGFFLSICGSAFAQFDADKVYPLMRSAMPSEAECRRGGPFARAYCGVPGHDYSITWEQDGSLSILVDANSDIPEKLKIYLPRIITFQEALGFASDDVNKCVNTSVINFQEWKKHPDYSSGVKAEQVVHQNLIMTCKVVGGYSLEIKTSANNRF